jgi:ubiquinone/menaquinone biosynthesis C-methylase UbiE
MLTWLFFILLVAIGLLLIYWELVIAEGAHLGPRVVAALYDGVARRYDEHIKKFDLETEAEILGLPLASELVNVDAPRVLDVACGTGRVARALLRQVAFDGTVFSLDLAARMLAEGHRAAAPWPGRVHWLRAPADRLPFPNRLFDCVTCVEALEFVPDARAVLRECVRVLKPGGLLVITNRVGWPGTLILGKTFSRTTFKHLMADLELDAARLRVEPWQVEYDLAWARKSEQWV